VLMKNPNFLILDEPTNDLDVYTLGVLEDYLDRFEGCVLAVSHDRYFLDRVVDQMFVFQDGFIKVFPGNYSRYHEYIKENAKPAEPKIKKPVAEKREPSRERQRRLSFKEKKELEELEKRMAALEEEKKALEEMMSSGAMASDELIKASERMGVLLKELDECEMRWLELSEIEG
jgi:ATP-binding cassette subfamily F protein uup